MSKLLLFYSDNWATAVNSVYTE